MGTRRFLPMTLVAATLLLVAGIAVISPSGLAQDAAGTPEATGHDHPAHIHAGTCATLGDVVHPLNNLTDADVGMMGTPMAGMMASPIAGMPMGDMMGTPMADFMAGMMAGNMDYSTTTVEAALDDILAGEHAINVHESPENIQNYIACGDLTGTPTNGLLQIQLNELNGSGYQGMAALQDNGDGTTTVIVVLMPTGAGAATPAATPAA
jgi:hypothetical protein